jgi:hypothetical protein
MVSKRGRPLEGQLSHIFRCRDPTFIKDFKKKYCTEVMVEHITQKKK